MIQSHSSSIVVLVLYEMARSIDCSNKCFKIHIYLSLSKTQTFGFLRYLHVLKANTATEKTYIRPSTCDCSSGLYHACLLIEVVVYCAVVS